MSMQGFNLKELMNIIHDSSQQAIKSDRLGDDRLWEELRQMLSYHDIDFGEATVIMLKTITHYGKINKVPHSLVTEIMDDGFNLTQLLIDIDLVKEFTEEVTMKNLATLKKRFDKTKHNWNKNVVLAFIASHYSTASDTSQLLALNLLNSSRDSKRDDQKEQVVLR